MSEHEARVRERLTALRLPDREINQTVREYWLRLLRSHRADAYLPKRTKWEWTLSDRRRLRYIDEKEKKIKEVERAVKMEMDEEDAMRNGNLEERGPESGGDGSDK